MNKSAAVAAIIFLLQLSLAAAIEESRETIFGSEELVLEVGLSSSFQLQAEKADYAVSYVNVNLTLFPKKGDSQKAEFAKLQPKPAVSDDYLLFQWDNPGVGKLSYKAVSEVRTRRNLVPVSSKVGFPVADLGGDL